MKDNKLIEEVKKAEVLSNAKPFIKEIKGLLERIETDLCSENSNTQMNGVIHAMALSESLKQYSYHFEEILKTFEEENNMKAVRVNDDGK